MADEKQKLIESMLEMQKKFIAFEHEQGLRVEDYFAPSADHPLADYIQEYSDMANKVVELAHREKGSLK